MIAYPDPTSRFHTPYGNDFDPDTALTPKIVAHGGGAIGGMQRVLKGNPVGWMQGGDGRYYPYMSARMEHFEQPVEHAMLESVDVDHYRLGQVMPRRFQNGAQEKIRPDAQSIFSWPDSSVSAPFRPHVTFGGLDHPGVDYPPATSYEQTGGRGTSR